jgi:hypothetical protein
MIIGILNSKSYILMLIQLYRKSIIPYSIVLDVQYGVYVKISGFWHVKKSGVQTPMNSH